MKWILAVPALLSLALFSPALANGQDKKEESKEKVTIDQCPEAVQATIKKEAEGGTIGEIVKVTKGDVVIYKAEITKDGKKTVIKVAADGKLIKSEGCKEGKKGDEGCPDDEK